MTASNPSDASEAARSLSIALTIAVLRQRP